MYIYLVTQTTNRDYDTYDGMVVYANSEEEARLCTPENCDYGDGLSIATFRGWTEPENVKVVRIGVADEALHVADTNGFSKPDNVVLVSFNAG